MGYKSSGELFSGDMEKSIYDTNDSGIVDKAETIDDGEGNSLTASELAATVETVDTISAPLLFKGTIALNSDFPTLSNVRTGWLYIITSSVIDNDPTKTNTGQSFVEDVDIAWNGSQWIELGLSKVVSVNSQTGNVILDQDDISDGTTYKQYSNTEKTKLSGIEESADVTDSINVGSTIHGVDAKGSFSDNDELSVIDSEDGNSLKKNLWSVVKSTLLSYFNTIYGTLSDLANKIDTFDEIFDSYLVLNFEGNDGDTTTTDETGRHTSITFNGDAEIDDAQSKFGNTSAVFDGNDSIQIADSNDFNIFDDNTNKTLDFFVKHSSTSDNQYYFDQYADGSNKWYIAYPGVPGQGIGLYASGNGSTLSYVRTNIDIVTDGDWHHVALVSLGTVYALYIDGVQATYSNVSWSSPLNIASDLFLGIRSSGSDLGMKGWMDGIRLTNGNIFGASPNVGKTDTITVPTQAPTSILSNDYVSQVESDGTLSRSDSVISDVEDSITKKHTQNTDIGTDSSIFQLDNDNSGVKLKNNSGVFEARNAADDDYADIRVEDLQLEANLKDGTNELSLANLIKGGLGYEINGGGAAIATGYKGGFRVPCDCTITGCYLFVTGTSGTIQVDIWKCSYSDYDGGSTHPADGDSITASAVPATSANTKDADTTLSGWTVTLSEGDWLGFNVDSNDTVEQVLVMLSIKKR